MGPWGQRVRVWAIQTPSAPLLTVRLAGRRFIAGCESVVCALRRSDVERERRGGEDIVGATNAGPGEDVAVDEDAARRCVDHRYGVDCTARARAQTEQVASARSGG